MTWTLYHFEVFQTVFEAKSISDAADRLYVSPSAVSHQIALFEEHLGLPLFERRGRRLIPTEASRCVYERGLNILQEAREMEATIADLKAAETGEIHLGGSIVPGTYLLPRFVSRFKQCYPQALVKLQVYPSEELFRELVRGTVDFGVTPIKPTHPQLVAETLCVAALVLIASAQSPPAQIPQRLNEIGDKPFICMVREQRGRENYDSILLAHGIRLSNIVLEVGHPEGVKQAVEAGLGLGITQRFVVKPELDTGRLLEVPIPGLEMKSSIYLVYRQHKYFSPIVERFIHDLREQLSTDI